MKIFSVIFGVFNCLVVRRIQTLIGRRMKKLIRSEGVREKKRKRTVLTVVISVRRQGVKDH